MKNIKQIREQYDLITEKEENEERKLIALVRAGLFDAKKIPALKKALEKPADKMTAQERRMLINLLDSLMSQVLSNQPVYQKVKQNVQRMDEAKTEYLSKFDPRFEKNYSEKDIPTVLILKRKAIRVYPDFQKVALYYAQAIDKYVSIPFGGINVGVMNEAETGKPLPTHSPTANTSSSKVTLSSGKKVSIGKKRSNITAIRAGLEKMNPIDRYFYRLGIRSRKYLPWRKKVKDKLNQTTTSDNTKVDKAARDASRRSEVRKLTVSHRLRSMKNQLDTMKSQLDANVKNQKAKEMVKPKSAARRFALNETFYERVALLREQRQLKEYKASDAASDAADILVPGVSAYKNFKKGNYGAAALDAAIDIGSVAAAPFTGGTSLAGRAALKTALKAGSKMAGKSGTRSSIRKYIRKAKLAGAKLARGTGRVARGAGRLALAGAALAGNDDNKSQNNTSYRKPAEQGYQFGKVKATTSDSFAQKNPTNDAQVQRDYQAQKRANAAMANPIRESVLKNLKKMIDEDVQSIEVFYGENSVNINNSTAKKIVNLYEEVNKTNKKKIEKMLDESATSFNKVLTFALRQ